MQAPSMDSAFPVPASRLLCSFPTSSHQNPRPRPAVPMRRACRHDAHSPTPTSNAHETAREENEPRIEGEEATHLLPIKSIPVWTLSVSIGTFGLASHGVVSAKTNYILRERHKMAGIPNPSIHRPDVAHAALAVEEGLNTKMHN